MQTLALLLFSSSSSFFFFFFFFSFCFCFYEKLTNKSCNLDYTICTFVGLFRPILSLSLSLSLSLYIYIYIYIYIYVCIGRNTIVLYEKYGSKMTRDVGMCSPKRGPAKVKRGNVFRGNTKGTFAERSSPKEI